MVFGISKDPGRLVSGAVLILCGLGQVTGRFGFDPLLTLIIAGMLFIMEALSW